LGGDGGDGEDGGDGGRWWEMVEMVEMVGEYGGDTVEEEGGGEEGEGGRRGRRRRKRGGGGGGGRGGGGGGGGGKRGWGECDNRLMTRRSGGVISGLLCVGGLYGWMDGQGHTYYRCFLTIALFCLSANVQIST